MVVAEKVASFAAKLDRVFTTDMSVITCQRGSQGSILLDFLRESDFRLSQNANPSTDKHQKRMFYLIS